MKSIQFTTIEELQQNYPIKSVIWSKTIRRAENRAYAGKIDLELLRRHYGPNNVEVLDGFYAKCWFDDTKQKIVEGYLFDGEYWYPAYNTWDGWIPYDEEDIID